MRQVRITRRTLLGSAGILSALAITGCGSDKPGAAVSAQPTLTNAGKAAGVYPNYKKADVPAPDLPGDGGFVSDGYLSYPKELKKSVQDKPANGSTYKVATVVFGTPEPTTSSWHKAIADATGCTFDFVQIPAADYATKVPTLLASGQVPDVLVLPSWENPAKFNAAVKGLFWDLTDKLAGDQVMKYPNLANFSKDVWSPCIWGGRLMSVPCPTELNPSPLYVRQDIIDKYKAPTPKDLETFKAFCTAVNKPKEGRYALGNIEAHLHMMYDLPWGWGERDGKVIHAYEMDAYPEMLAFWKSLYTNQWIHPDIVANWWGDSQTLFMGGKVAAYCGGPGNWRSQMSAKQNPSMEPSFVSKTLVPFTTNGEIPHVDSNPPAVFQSFFNKKLSSDKVDELLRVYNYLAAPFGTEEYQLINFGKEGEHFTMKNGNPVKTDAGTKQISQFETNLTGGPAVSVNFDYPQYVKDVHAWQTAVAPKAKLPLIAGIRPDVSFNDQKYRDAVNDMLRGRKPLSDFAALKADFLKAAQPMREAYAKEVELRK